MENPNVKNPYYSRTKLNFKKFSTLFIILLLKQLNQIKAVPTKL